MIAAPTNRASAAGRRWAPALTGLGIVVLTVAACGSSGTTATVAGTATASPAAQSGSPAPAGAQAAFPGVIGTAAAVSGSSLEVQNPTSGQVTVTFSATTPITQTVAVTSKDVTVGSCVTVVGKPSAAAATGGAAAARSVTATSVTISAAVKGNCAGAGAGAGGFGGFGRGAGGGGSSPRPSFSPRPRPTGSRGAFGGGAFGAFGGANGKVLSVSASGFVVQGRSRAAGSDTSITVITTAASKYLKTVTAGPSALKVGQCVTALGTANSIGAVAARSIRISQPGPNGCVSGFGGRGGFGGFGGSGRPTTNA